MSSESVKATISQLTYDPEVNLFTMVIQDLENKRQATLAIKGTDWGITPEVPIEVINEFCSSMLGKEKNFFLEIDKTTMQNESDQSKKLSDEKMKKICDNLDNYPIHEIGYKIQKEFFPDGDKKD